MTLLNRLTNTLRAAGLSGDCCLLRVGAVVQPGWVVIDTPLGRKLRVDGGATAAQARAALVGFDWAARERAETELAVDIAALSQAEKDALLLKLLSRAVKEDPDLAPAIPQVSSGLQQPRR